MAKQTLWLFGLILAGAVAQAGTKADGKAKADAKPKYVHVVLSSTTNRLDSLTPGTHRLKCVVRNISGKAVAVPSQYSGRFDGDLSLIARGKARWDLNLVFWGGPKGKETKVLEPGQELVVFDQALRDILLLDFKDAKTPPLVPGEKRWYWNWSA